MIRRLKNLWSLSKKDQAALEVLETLTPEQLAEVPEATSDKAVFLGEGTEEEFIEQERADSGLSGWYERLRNL